MYASNIGTFLQRDPLEMGERTTLLDSHDRVTRLRTNLYEYVDSQPAASTDPFGLQAWQIHNPANPQLPFGPAPAQAPPANKVCGLYAWLYAGSGIIPDLSYCVDKDVYDNAIEAAGEFVQCWWQCEVRTHKCGAGIALDTVEVVSGTISILSSRIPKLPTEIVDPTDIYKGLFRDVSRKIGNEAADRFFRNLTRSPVAKVAKGTLVVVAYIEAGISISCSASC